MMQSETFKIREDLDECLAIAGDSKVVCTVSERTPEKISEILEGKFAEDGSLPNPASADSAESKCALQLPRDSIQADETKYARMVQKCSGALRGPPQECIGRGRWTRRAGCSSSMRVTA